MYGVDEADLELRLVHASAWCNREIAAIVWRLSHGGERCGVLLAVHFYKESLRFLTREGLEARVPKRSFSDAFLQCGADTIYNCGIDTNAGHQKKVTPLACVLGGGAAHLDASGLSSRDHVGRALQLSGQSQCLSHDSPGAARPYPESDASAEQALD